MSTTSSPTQTDRAGSDRQERIVTGESIPLDPSIHGVSIRTLVSAACGARGFTTGLAVFQPGGVLPYHTHDWSEAITVLSGAATVLVEGRAYRIGALDCIHVPAGVAHSVRNESELEVTAHTAFGSDQPARLFVAAPEAGWDSGQTGPEFVRRKAESEVYELSPGAFFTDLFAKRFGSVGICGGYGRFQPGASLPCHIHEYDESITIVEGTAKCLVQGAQYSLTGLETAFIPTHRAHRFINESDSAMAMIWVYAGNEPDRVILDNTLCAGSVSQ